MTKKYFNFITEKVYQGLVPPDRPRWTIKLGPWTIRIGRVGSWAVLRGNPFYFRAYGRGPRIR